MTVSVIIPTYNRAALLDRCLRSLVGTDMDDLEVIVVDDGGKDDTASVCARYPQVRYIWQTNAGVSAARNHGFRLSRGTHVAFIDSDDEWINGGLSRLARQCAANPDIGVLFADTSMGNDDTGYVSFVQEYGDGVFFDLPADRRQGVRVFEREPFLIQLSTRNVMFLGSMVFRRDVFEALGGFDQSLSGAADWDIFMRATASTVVAFSDGEPVSRYYKHDAGMSTNSDHMEEDFIKALDRLRTRGTLSRREREHVDWRIREHAFGWAFQAYERGDLTVARSRLAYARRLGQMGPREFAYWLATHLPSGLVSTLRRVRHGLGY
jgi:glycosyltransferase involved in cell wall biosynthesis